MRADVRAGLWLHRFIAHYLESCTRCLLTHGDVGKCRRMVWKCSLKCLAHAPIVLVFLLLSLGQARRLGRLPERMSEVNIKNIFLGSGYWFINKSTPGQRPSVLMAWVTSPLHLPWSLWIRPTEHKPPVLPAGEGWRGVCKGLCPAPGVLNTQHILSTGSSAPSPQNSPLWALYSRLKLSSFRNKDHTAILTSL